ncbi:MAG: long-chain fatty acid--CoA ligase, partial [archaeon]|nr:long-chain fatty acid--CoA ligase [archaeon]
MKITTNIDENSPWFNPKVWPSRAPKQLTWDDTQIVYDLLVEKAQEIPDNIAYWFAGSFTTYKELLHQIDCFATGLLKIGVKKGDVVGFCLMTCPQFVIASYACSKIGAIFNGINPTYKPMEIVHQLKVTKLKWIICLDILGKKVLAPL